MNKIIGLIVVLLIVISQSYAQQDIIFPVNRKLEEPKNLPDNKERKVTDIVEDDEDIIPSDLDVDKNYEEYTFPFPVTLYANTIEELSEKGRQEVVKATFSRYCKEHTDLLCLMLEYHCGKYVRINLEDYIMPTKGNDKKLGKYKLFVEKALVNKKLINYIAFRVDRLMAPNTVVLYNPVRGSIDEPTKKLYEDVRERAQSNFVNYIYKMTQIKNIDVMPVCNVPKDTVGVNLYRELLECVRKTKRITAEIVISVNDIIIKSVNKEEGGYTADVELHLQIFNANTYSFVLDDYSRKTAFSQTKEAAVQNAINYILQENMKKYMIQMTGTYYNYVMQGREWIIDVYQSCYKTQDEFDKFTDLIKKNKSFEILTEDQKDTGKELSCKTYEITQFKIAETIRKKVLKPLGWQCEAKPEGVAIIIK